MANLVPAVAGGNWSAAASWIDVATGLAPAAAPIIGTDDCYLGSSGTNPTVTNIAAATSGATSVTLTFTGTARAGMAFKIAGTAGVYILLVQATSGASVEIVPALEANVTAGSAVTCYNCGNITIDNTTATCGTAKTITAAAGGGSLIIGRGATLAHAKGANTKLVVRGSIFVCPGGVYDCGTTAAPIQAGFTAEVQVNALASPSFGAHVFKVGRVSTNGRPQNGDGTKVTFIHATSRTRNVQLASTIAATGTSGTLATTPTGWTSTDDVVFSPTGTTGMTSGDNTAVETRTLNSYSGTSIGWASGLSVQHLAGGHVGNLTSGIILNGVSSSQGFAFHADVAGNVNDLCFEFENVTISQGSAWTGDTSFQASITISYTSGVTSSARNLRINACAWSNLRRNALLISSGRVKANTVDGCAIHSADATRVMFYFGNSCGGAIVQDCTLYKFGRVMQSTFGAGTIGNTFRRCVFTGGPNDRPAIDITEGTGELLEDCVIAQAQYAITINNTGSLTLRRCSFGVNNPTYGGGGGGFTTAIFNANQLGTVGAVTLDNCAFNPTDPTCNQQTSNLSVSEAASYILLTNTDGDPTNNKEMTRTGDLYRDNSIISRGRSSLRINPKLAATAKSKALTLPSVSAGVAIVVKGRIRYDTNYGGTIKPTVTLSLGAQTQTFTATVAALNAWEEFSLTITPASSGTPTLTATGQPDATSGLFYIDGVPVAPWCDWAWHYGCTYNPSSPYCVTDPYIGVSTEATVASYTGFSYDGTTLTVTTNHTTQELWDWMTWYAASNRLAPILTGTPAAIGLPKNLVLDGCTLTGTGGTLTITTGKTVSMINSATLASLQILSATSGDTGLITITGLTSSSVAIYDNSGVRQDFQSGVTGSYSKFLTIPNTGTWTYVIKRPGYEVQMGTFNANSLTSVAAIYTQILNADGSVAYTGSTSALLSVSFTGTTQGNIDIGNGSVTPQQVFDETEDALATAGGMDWFADGKTRVSQFNSSGGDYVFLSTGWRLRRASAGDVNATLNAFAISADGTVVDGTNGSVMFLTSDSPTAIAAAVWAYATRTLTASSDPTAAAIATQVRTELSPELTAVDELHRIHGLKSGAPLTVTPTSRTSGAIAQVISGDGVTSTTVTRS